MAVRKPSISKRRQVTIPQAAMDAAGLHEGEPLNVRVTEDGILLARADEREQLAEGQLALLLEALVLRRVPGVFERHLVDRRLEHVAVVSLEDEAGRPLLGDPQLCAGGAAAVHQG